MALIHEIITSENIKGFYNAKNENVENTLGENAFPPKQQLGLKLSFIKGAAGKPVTLKAAAFDTKVPLRDRMAVELLDEEMPFFKEAMVVKEADRQQLNILSQTKNNELIDTILASIYNDQATLIAGAKARLEAMRMEVLSKGKIHIQSNGVMKDIDYGLAGDQTTKPSKKWSEVTATPLKDIEGAIEKMAERGFVPEAIIMNSKTFSLIKNAENTLDVVKPMAPNGAAVTKRDLNTYLEDELQVKVILKDGMFVGDDGESRKYFPDGFATLVPNGNLGYTVFGTTPEQSDLLGGEATDAEVSIVETGIAITTTKTTDPVNVQTKVSMIALPSFERLAEVQIIDANGEETKKENSFEM
ncbi:major capsid protein [Streptococcus pyogenes]|uniref:major capsid protein n=1 Tax=Streptococcus pyogenes TaxID=1314 RepID=UPI00050CEF95|nr:major capsid protein [Streptococcus pyogenes]KGE55727.1 phage major capsid E family protein [Streptococcus pyogenes AA216]HER4799435.1 major capsid protein [Streptococcus pyogenes NGAS113]ASO67790.1 minor capsid protein E [Streptococcus pyogenes]ASO73508.1 minor capsid protein E [Streptococcus pyogenes]OAC59764.1 major capsid protein E [Streptococcus pyogenes]